MHNRYVRHAQQVCQACTTGMSDMHNRYVRQVFQGVVFTVVHRLCVACTFRYDVYDKWGKSKADTRECYDDDHTRSTDNAMCGFPPHSIDTEYEPREDG